MELNATIGHQSLRAELRERVQNKTLPQVSLFYGVAGVGKKRVAIEIVRQMMCDSGLAECSGCLSCQQVMTAQHPDVFLITPTPPKSQSKKKDDEGNVRVSTNLTIKVEDVESVKNRLRHRPMQGAWQIVVIDEAHLMTEATANSLLKLLEEPRPHQIFILVTSQFHRVLPTLRSRSAKFHFGALSAAEVELIFQAQEMHQDVDPDLRQFLSGAFEGSVSTIVQMLDAGFERALVQEFLSVRGQFLKIMPLVRSLCDREMNLRTFLQCVRFELMQTQRHTPDADTLDFLDRMTAAERQIARHIQKEFVLETLLL